MDAHFEAAVAPYRRELLALCYRMTGSLVDAEDVLQDALVRAWRGLPGFEGRASLRTWLYRVTTNACLNALAERRARSLPQLAGPAGRPDDVLAPQLEPVWLEAFPDSLLEDDPADRPDAVYTRREAVRLAFITALQRLPARQRAVLVLRDVMGMSAEETAEALELGVAACNSLLQRARDGIAIAKPHEPEPRALAALLDRYVAAWESRDADAFVAVLRADAIAAMPPTSLWVRGHADIVAAMRRLVWTGAELRLVPIALNAAPGFAVYQAGAFAALNVVDVEGSLVAASISFLAADPRLDPTRYGLARTL